ncbi:DUF4202 family protein [Patescibacteria group bacterium]
MNKMYDKVKKWLEQNAKPRQMVHFERTAHWARELRPDADEAMLIAALTHDIERVFSKRKHQKTEGNLHEPEYLKMHQEGGAQIVGEFLKDNGADDVMIERVKMMIVKHEEGGNDDQNVIMDADSISFFENNVDHFVDDLMEVYGRENTKEKFSWMYDRMSSDRAKEIAKEWYDSAMKRV